eukprot:TRINITY_DN17795_c0_g1_i2.p1 TRINITY_DN17795_c0_g1~~TRINITY_DN17795_c0_g1_i2.p1  ORF type:complete len:779 (-),score=180.67 TRINITY_DN17795_c0_g1_i2:207-2474(-)
MSSKQLKKLRELREAEAAAAAGAKEEEAEDDSDEEEAERKPQISSFAAFGDSSSSDAEAAEAPKKVEKVERIEADTSESKKKMKRRKAKKGAAAGPATAVDKGKKSIDDAESEEDEEEALLEQEALRVKEEMADDFANASSIGSQSLEASPLALRKADFSTEAERRKATGVLGGGDTLRQRRGGGAARARGQAEGITVHHRRLFLVNPTAEEPWPRPDDTMVMTCKNDAEGAAIFDFEESSSSARSLEALRDCLRSQDPNLVQQWMQRSSQFNVDGLLVLAEYHRGQAHHEQAASLTRKAVYALECAFSADFSPFHPTGVGPAALRPRVRLQIDDSADWPGWSWLRAMWLYMSGLAGQGMHRTALEVCKLLLAATLPRDPLRSLLWFDYLCLRSRQFEALSKHAYHMSSLYNVQGKLTSGEAALRLDLALPNFAYSIPLASFMKDGKSPDFALLNQVSIDDLISKAAARNAESEAEDSTEDAAALPQGAAAHARLMRALLFFPLALRPLLEEAGEKLEAPAPSRSPSRETWVALLARPPFSDGAGFGHERHKVAQGRIAGAYAKRCGSLWKANSALVWLHACASRLASMHESSAFASELAAARSAWSSSDLCVDGALNDFDDLWPEEGSMEGAVHTPPSLEKALQARLYPPQDEYEVAAGRGGPFGFGEGGGGTEVLTPTMSLHTPPLILFFQSLLPWSEIDKNGTRVQPLFWSDLVKNSFSAAQSTALFLAGVVADICRLLGFSLKSLKQRLQG